jgi:transcriptional activator Myb
MTMYFRYVPPSPARLAQDITEIMQNDQLENDKDAASETKIPFQKQISNDSHYQRIENTSKLQQHQKQLENSWESSDMSYLAETPVSVF